MSNRGSNHTPSMNLNPTTSKVTKTDRKTHVHLAGTQLKSLYEDIRAGATNEQLKICYKLADATLKRYGKAALNNNEIRVDGNQKKHQGPKYSEFENLVLAHMRKLRELGLPVSEPQLQ
ncbi:hypothetical protein HK098_005520, partial [Nowakowskiella sp. JEL0407]